MSTTEILFWFLTALALMGALMVVSSRNPVHSVLWLIMVFFAISGHYILMNAQFLAIVNMIVYAGAIMVLFLFVIMLLNLGSSHLLQEKFDPKKFLGVLLGLGLFGAVGSQVLPAFLKASQPGAIEGYGSPQTIGRALFTQYVYPFEAISVLLLVGVVGSIMLAKRRI